MAKSYYDPQHPEAWPALQAVYITDSDEEWETIARAHYEVGDPKTSRERLDTAIQWLQAANPAFTDRVPSGESVHVPAIPGLPPLFSKVEVPVLPDPKDRPPEPGDLASPSLDDGLPTGTPQQFTDTIHQGCRYNHQFFVRHGPLQKKEQWNGWCLYVKFMGRDSVSIMHVGMSFTALFTVYKAECWEVRVWQWREIWDKMERLCTPPGTSPGNKQWFIPIRGSGKWVQLSTRIEQRNAVPIQEFWAHNGEPTEALKCANDLVEEEVKKGEPFSRCADGPFP